jgi:hypothetical protein
VTAQASGTNAWLAELGLTRPELKLANINASLQPLVLGQVSLEDVWLAITHPALGLQRALTLDPSLLLVPPDRLADDRASQLRPNPAALLAL